MAATLSAVKKSKIENTSELERQPTQPDCTTRNSTSGFYSKELLSTQGHMLHLTLTPMPLTGMVSPWTKSLSRISPPPSQRSLPTELTMAMKTCPSKSSATDKVVSRRHSSSLAPMLTLQVLIRQSLLLPPTSMQTMATSLKGLSLTQSQIDASVTSSRPTSPRTARSELDAPTGGEP